MKDPDNKKNSTCGNAGLACKDCASSNQTCTAAFACSGGATGGGAGGGSGGGSGNCNSTTCTNGCCAAGVCIPVGSAQGSLNCGKMGAACMQCPSGNTCSAGACVFGDAGQPSLVGEACTMPADCSALGAGSTCKTSTAVGNGTYEGGYCTIQPCSGNCPASDSVCVQGLIGVGEPENMCLKKCSVASMNCRTGYRCYGLQGGTDEGVCYLDQTHLPSYIDAGRPADKIGSACTADTQCQNPPDPPFQDLGFCYPQSFPDGGPTGYTGGYCFGDCTDFDICGAQGVCLGVSNTLNLCFQRCTTPRGGMDTCRSGYVCQPTFFRDGGFAPDAYCDTSCLAAGNPCGTGRTCSSMGATAGYCVLPDGGF